LKGLLGAPNYNNGVMDLPVGEEEIVTTDYGLGDLVLNALINRRDANTNRAR
jgi:hypothetical protein